MFYQFLERVLWHPPAEEHSHAPSRLCSPIGLTGEGPRLSMLDDLTTCCNWPHAEPRSAELPHCIIIGRFFCLDILKDEIWLNPVEGLDQS